MTRWLIVAAAALLLLTGCGQDPEVEAAQPTTSSPSSSPETTTSTTTTTAATPDPAVICALETSPALLVMSWELVTASRGAPDHKQWVDAFAAEIDDRQDDLEDEGCAGGVALAELGVEVAFLNLMITAQGEATAAQYQAVVDQGNAWLDEIGHTGEPFAVSSP